jgi:hypothetical protein
LAFSRLSPPLKLLKNACCGGDIFRDGKKDEGGNPIFVSSFPREFEKGEKGIWRGN